MKKISATLWLKYPCLNLKRNKKPPFPFIFKTHTPIFAANFTTGMVLRRSKLLLAGVFTLFVLLFSNNLFAEEAPKEEKKLKAGDILMEHFLTLMNFTSLLLVKQKFPFLYRCLFILPEKDFPPLCLPLLSMDEYRMMATGS